MPIYIIQRQYYIQRMRESLAPKVFEYYKAKGYQYVDVGPSTEDSLPNYGLCEFKESIGCDISQKYTYIKNIVS